MAEIAAAAAVPENTEFYQPGMAFVPVTDAVPVAAPDTAGESKGPQAPAAVGAMAPADGLKYIAVGFSAGGSLFLRSDGQIDRSTDSGVITSRHACDEKGVLYVGIAAGLYASFGIRSDGKLDKYKSATDIRRGIACPDAGVKFVSGSCADSNNYFLGDNGQVYRVPTEYTFGGSNTITRFPCPEGLTYRSVAGGLNASYFVRSDGKIVYSRGQGKVTGTVDQVDEVDFVGTSSQLVLPRQGAGIDVSNPANYFVRADGALLRATGIGKIHCKVSPPAGIRYLAASTGVLASYYIRSDGAVDRTTGTDGTVSSTMNPPPGTKYIQVSAGNTAVYVLRSDGIVDRSVSKGIIQMSMTANNEAPKKGSSCSVM